MQGWGGGHTYLIYMTPLFENKIETGLKTFMNKFTDPDYKLIVRVRQQKSKFFDVVKALEILLFLIYH